MYAVIRRLKSTTPIRSIYIESDKKAEIFTEMNDFLEQSHKRYNIEVHQTSGGIKEALGEIFFNFEKKTEFLGVVKSEHPNIKAIMMGTRVDDPHGKYVSEFCLTDTDEGFFSFSFLQFFHFFHRMARIYEDKPHFELDLRRCMVLYPTTSASSW